MSYSSITSSVQGGGKLVDLDGLGACEIRRGTLIDESAKPQLQNQEEPQTPRIVAAPALVLVDQRPNRALVEVPALTRRAVGQRIPEHLAQLVVEPMGEGHGKSVFGPV